MSDFNEGRRWASITLSDSSGLLYIAAILTLIYSTLAFAARVYIKWGVQWLDDAAMCVAQIASICQFAILWTSLSAGSAKSYASLSRDEYTRMASAQYYQQIALYVSLGFSKIATILLILFIFRRARKATRYLCKSVLVVLVSWTVAATLLIAVECRPSGLAPKTSAQLCTGIMIRYKTLVFTDVGTNAVLAILPTAVCWRIQMHWTRKAQIAAVFAFWLLPMALAIWFFWTWEHSLTAEDPGVTRGLAIAIQQGELCTSLIAATVPCLKSLLIKFDTGSGVKAGTGSNGCRSTVCPANDAENGLEAYAMSILSRSERGLLRSQTSLSDRVRTSASSRTDRED